MRAPRTEAWWAAAATGESSGRRETRAVRARRVYLAIELEVAYEVLRTWEGGRGGGR